MDSRTVYLPKQGAATDAEENLRRRLEEAAAATDRAVHVGGEIPLDAERMSAEEVVARLRSELVDAASSAPNDLDREPGESYTEHLRRRLVAKRLKERV